MGKVVNAEMILSPMGKIVNDEFLKSFEIRDELFLHEYVIMPNHVHMIVEIRNPDIGDSHSRANPPDVGLAIPPDTNHSVFELSDFDGLQINRNMPIRLPKSISSFMAGFKSAVNTQIDNYIDEQNLKIPKYNRNNHFFQSNYHDHIIRNDFEYQRIKNYIIQNPAKWERDSLK